MESGRVMHETNSGRDAKPVVLFFEGGSVFWIMGGLALSLLLFRRLHGTLHWGLMESLAAGGVPLALAAAYVLTLKQGKPPRYDLEVFESAGFRLRAACAEAFGLRLRPFLAAAKAKGKHPLASERHETC